MVPRERFARRRYRYDEIVERIQAMIREGEIKVGDRLPPERALAGTFRVSRNCVRQAVQALAEKRILESRQGDGTYVCGPDPSILADSLTVGIRVQTELLRDIVEFRRLMEPQIAYLAAQNITREELDHLKVIVCDQERRILAGEKDTELDAAFHLRLAEASKNRVILQVVHTLNAVLNASRSEALRSDARRRASTIGHLKIIDALEKGDPDGAYEAMKEHLLTVERILFGMDQEGHAGFREGEDLG